MNSDSDSEQLIQSLTTTAPKVKKTALEVRKMLVLVYGEDVVSEQSVRIDFRNIVLEILTSQIYQVLES